MKRVPTNARAGLGLDLEGGSDPVHTTSPDDFFTRATGQASSLSGDVAPNIAGGAASPGGMGPAPGATVGAIGGAAIAGTTSSDAPMSTTEKVLIGVGAVGAIALLAVAVHFARKKG